VKTRTYLGLSGQLLYSTVRRTDGAYTLDPSINNKVFPSSILENLDYRERSVTFSVDQLLGDEWALGGRYRLTEGKLDDDFPEVTATTTVTAPFVASQRLEALLHQIELHTIYQHPSGLFGQVQAIWSLQHSSGYSPALADEDFWQFNVYAGYRFARRRVEVVLGVLNLTDRNYQLNPLTLYNELPRERTFLARLRFAF
jgi:outer membrane receptor for ferric coprogen and ferric-rhodotorulic acid